MPMPIASRLTTVYRPDRLPRLLAAGFLALALNAIAAEGDLNVADLKTRSTAGDKTATRQLAEAYYLGKGVEQNFTEAARWYLVLAKQGDARAQTSIGLMYARGYGVDKNAAEARRWWQFAALQNDPAAQFNLGLLLTQSDPPVRDYAQAVEWYRKAASRGHLGAQHNLGMMYYEGKGTARDPVRAYFWVALAAKQGDDIAEDSLRNVGNGMSKEQITEAQQQVEEWMKKAKQVWK